MKRIIGIRDIAYFIHMSGDLTNEFFSNKDQNDGKKAHQYLQKKYSSSDRKEFFIKQELQYQNEDIVVQGFIDGVLDIEGLTVLEEIKSTMVELDEITLDYHEEHLAQLKIYGYLYSLQNGMDSIHLRLTYISLLDYSIKSFDLVLKKDDLEQFFFDSLDLYLSFDSMIRNFEQEKIETIKTIKFPYSNMRIGQRDLMTSCFNTMKNNQILYAIAPTGIGKTMATVFSALKSINNENEKIFYLTAKGMGKNSCLDALKLLRSKGLSMKSIDITAKSKSCNIQKRNCDPEICPYAKGFFQRLKDATEDILNNEDILEYNILKKYSEKHKICLFEYTLYLSYFCDFIIADYNYVFDPKAHLVRYFDDDSYKPKLLIDEAHNLVSRAKEMYSSRISTNNLIILRKNLTGIKPSCRNDINKALEILEKYEDKVPLNDSFFQKEMDIDLYNILFKIRNKCEQIFTEQKEFKNRDQAIEQYFNILDFVRISDYYGPNHRFLIKKEEDNIVAIIYCLDASKFILDTIEQKCYGTIFFSATLYPLKYYMDLLTMGKGNCINLKSSFKKSNLNLIINDNISTKYRDRFDSIDKIISTIDILTSSKIGNYIVFFPSYSYLNMVLSNLHDVNYNYFVQKSSMTDEERHTFFNYFRKNDVTQVGFFVLGGVFSEGLDYIGDLLSGVIIVGVGIPQVCTENNLLKEYFDEKYEQGFDYAYTYPGFNKVVQASGRVIRSEDDTGVVILLDERYKYLVYQSLMPDYWSERKVINTEYRLRKELDSFWEKK